MAEHRSTDDGRMLRSAGARLRTAVLAPLAVLAVVTAACSAPPAQEDPAPPTTPTTTTTPTTVDTAPIDATAVPPSDGARLAVCGTDALAAGPTSPPAGAVAVAAGDNSAVDFSRADTTYWFAPGVHTLTADEFAQIIPGDNATFVGAPGAVLDGQRRNAYAFTQRARDVTIRFMTIQNFVPPRDQGVVNHDSADGWLIEHNTITRNEGAAMMAGARQKVLGNCLKDNGQYGLNAAQDGHGIVDLRVEGNEFVGNNTGDWETKVSGCGCAGAMKFWAVNGATVRNNWVHDNKGPGVWADTNNNDFLIEDNLIEGNDSMGVFYEISYNAIIRNNTIRNNAWATGLQFADRDDNFPIGAIYLSEAGGDPRLPARTSFVEITGNTFTNNWGGIVGWENADRYCNSPVSVTEDCTLTVGWRDTSTCSQPAIAAEPLLSDCRWKTQRLRIHHNTFTHDPAAIAGGCPTTFCGRTAVFSNWGTVPDWSPYMARFVQDGITFRQDNRWYDNIYVGTWRFVAYETGNDLSLAQWQAGPYRQDANSTG